MGLLQIIYGAPHTQDALTGLRDWSSLQWYVIPFIAIIFYIYSKEIKIAKETGNWEIIICGLTVFGMDFFNESWNGWVCWFSQESAVWTDGLTNSAFKVMVGWNIEIIFMFLINGIVFGYMINKDSKKKIIGLNNRWFWGIGLAAFSVFIECILNYGGQLLWYYPWWERSFGGVWLIFLFGYFHFYVACILVLKLKTTKNRFIAVVCIWTVPILMNIIAAISGMYY